MFVNVLQAVSKYLRCVGSRFTAHYNCWHCKTLVSACWTKGIQFIISITVCLKITLTIAMNVCSCLVTHMHQCIHFYCSNYHCTAERFPDCRCKTQQSKMAFIHCRSGKCPAIFWYYKFFTIGIAICFLTHVVSHFVNKK